MNGQNTQHNTQGFTIVELMVVIAILSILTALSVVGYRDIQERAYDASVKSTINEVAKALQNYNTKHGIPPKYYSLTLEDKDVMPEPGPGRYDRYTGGTIGRALIKEGLLPPHFQDHLKKPKASNPAIKKYPTISLMRCVETKDSSPVFNFGYGEQTKLLTSFKKDVIVVYARTHSGVEEGKFRDSILECANDTSRHGEEILYRSQGHPSQRLTQYGWVNDSDPLMPRFSYVVVPINDHQNKQHEWDE
ncbi:MAG: prepilin-type N-terminal cleavage/methylation domain-containing protein [Candidatus Saccharibacteria bacterium]|nr:prepilin-type N-terminal cleavage/methylation domain-containing protein [Candidatus Saccharibacteria bacterium]